LKKFFLCGVLSGHLAGIIQSVRVAGLGARLPEFVGPLEEEFHCEVRSLLDSAVSDGRVKEDLRPLADRELEGLIGWMLQHV